MLDDSRVGHCQSGEDKAHRDTGNGTKGETDFAEEGVKEVIAYGDEDDYGQGVDVLHEVVGDPVEFHDAGLGDEVVEHLRVDDPVNGKEGKDPAGDKAALELIDEMVSPGGFVPLADGRLVGGASGV